MQEILEMAGRLGQNLARTEEYKALKRAIDASGDDRELAELQTEMQKLERELQSILQNGREPSEEQTLEYEKLFGRLQSNASYQRLVTTQTNFDKVVQKVNETIHQGIQKGAESRIILT